MLREVRSMSSSHQNEEFHMNMLPEMSGFFNLIDRLLSTTNI